MHPRTFSSPFSLLLITGLLGVLLKPPLAPAAAPCDPPVARMVSVQGNVEVRRAGQTLSQPARLNETYCPGDRIQVGERSRADVALVNQPVLRLDQNTTITLAGLKEERTSLIDLARGAMHFFSRLPRNLEVNTAFVNAGVEGTEGVIEVQADRTLVTIFEGRVLAANAAGSLSLTDGQSAVAEQGRAPVLRTVVRPRDAVQWALYYPPVAYFRPEDFRGTEPWEGMVRNSLEANTRGDYQRAFDALKGAPADITDPRFFAYRASLLLGVGRVDEAGPDFDRALKLNPNYSDALALQSIVAVVQNDKERALSVTDKAVTAEPKSASALTALSYAQQANFDLEGARNSLERAVQAEPNNALAWARLAELHMSFAELDKALQAAEKAVSLNPNLSRTQMVLGFAHLTRISIDESKRAFERAIELDQADSLSRLGLGLAKIRESNFEEGRRDIEVAASLDPNNSIVRSYLGKAYYEEKRTGLDEREYATAKELDPRDPTPFFYDAIQKQTTNRPIEALQDMERAIELNDNRAVYRSRLQLDSDLAARSASLARIYTDLGFQQLALVEGWKSVNTDPTNFSAHRFLADSYSALPRHEIARVSELLQSQLLQPLNMTPIQPRLAESNLFLISAGGPGAVSFNEFNPIFNRDGITFQTSGLAGENSTYSGEGILSGIFKKASFSLGGFHFKTDGWRTKAFQNDSVGNAFLQLELSPDTSVQSEYRYRYVARGDLQQRFFEDDFSRDRNNRRETHTIRFGGRHAFSPDSLLLGSFIYQQLDSRDTDHAPPFEPFTGINLTDLRANPVHAYGTELKHLWRSRYFNLTSGVGFVDTIGNEQVRVGIPGPTVIRLPSTDLENRHFNAYAYGHINLIKNVTFTLGASVDSVRGSSDIIPPNGDKDQLNPKFGITWTPFSTTTVRAAVFRALKRSLITDQTLEPTQVAGFNQFYDDFPGAESRRYGVAIDQKFTREIFGGAEFGKRDITTPFIAVGGLSPVTRESKTDEHLARAYFFWAPQNWLALRTEYVYERFKSDIAVGENPLKLHTHRVPLGINLFDPSGLSASLTATYWNQDGKFFRLTTGLDESGRDDFWTVDTAINFRLPKRYGFISVGATNLFDKKFKYFNIDFDNPNIQPSRMVFGRITLALP